MQPVRNLILAAATVAGLGACSLPPQLSDTQRCQGYGWLPGTDRFSECLMGLDGQRRALAGAMMGALIVNRMAR